MPEVLERPINAAIHLTETQKAQFARDGYLILRGLFRSEEIVEIREAYMTQAKDGPVEGLSEMKAGDRDYDAGDPLAFYPRMLNPHSQPERMVGQIARDFLLDPRLYPILHDLFGEEPVGVQTMFYFKPAGARGQELHQDNFYLRVKPGTCMAAWLAVDDVDAENGGMKVVPGSHREEIVCPQTADPAVSFTTDYVPVPPGMEAVHTDMKAGDVLFFNGSVIHGSTPNTSATRFRRSLIAHYVPRYSQELSPWYKTPMAFDGAVVSIAEATGGGPCGTPQMALGPH